MNTTQNGLVRLMSLPANDTTRPKLKDRIRLTPAQLNSKTATWLTLSAEYTARRVFAAKRRETLPYNEVPAWTKDKHCGATWKAKYDTGDSFRIPGSIYGMNVNAENPATVRSYIIEFERLNKLLPQTA